MFDFVNSLHVDECLFLFSKVILVLDLMYLYLYLHLHGVTLRTFMECHVMSH